MSSEQKGTASASDFEVDSHDLYYQARQKKIRLIDSARLGLTALALLCGLTILGTSADTLAVYKKTHLSTDFNLPLWPEDFDLRPTVALVTGSAIVVVANVISLLFSKVMTLRNQALVHTSMTFAAPFVGFLAVMISMIFFYAVNASIRVDTLQSWSCHWGYANMLTEPHFGTLCKESETALYLSVVLVPVELVVLTMAAYQMVLERKTGGGAVPARKTSSPALS
ncbi:hypothetical protein F4778DRAFT_586826 [Xylariomycetidae sp. FL2044]|nr:hypothetical protein F4778DRAFT_586826 [Xylariomycetidae sp. FL2044]